MPSPERDEAIQRDGITILPSLGQTQPDSEQHPTVHGAQLPMPETITALLDSAPARHLL